MSVEYTTLEKCTSQLKSALKSDIKEIAKFLFQEGFITIKFYEEVLEPNSTSSVDADKLLLQVMRRVKLDPTVYYKFVNFLRLNQKKYDDLMDLVDAEYFGIKKLPTSCKLIGIKTS